MIFQRSWLTAQSAATSLLEPCSFTRYGTFSRRQRMFRQGSALDLNWIRILQSELYKEGKIECKAITRERRIQMWKISFTIRSKKERAVMVQSKTAQNGCCFGCRTFEAQTTTRSMNKWEDLQIRLKIFISYGALSFLDWAGRAAFLSFPESECSSSFAGFWLNACYLLIDLCNFVFMTSYKKRIGD